MENVTEAINKCIITVAEKFIIDPFKYFCEKDLHFELQEQFKKKFPSGPYYIHRECPVLVEGFEYGKGKKKTRKTALIDLVVTSLDDAVSERALLGIEMFLGNFNDEGLIAIGPRKYFINKSSFTDKDALKHLKDDYWKLKRKTPNKYLLVYFLTHVFTRDTSGYRRERINRISRITDILQSYTEIDQDRLIIIETIYENGIETNRQKLGLPTLKSNLPTPI